MQALPYLVVEGTVVATRRQELEAREPEEYTTASGQVKTTRRRPASSFMEAGISCPVVINDQVDSELRAILTVRIPDELGGKIKKGDAVRWAIQVEQLKVFMGGRFREWLVYYWRGDAPVISTAGLAVASRPTAVSA
jgi:hypothetical protein